MRFEFRTFQTRHTCLKHSRPRLAFDQHNAESHVTTGNAQSSHILRHTRRCLHCTKHFKLIELTHACIIKALSEYRSEQLTQIIVLPNKLHQNIKLT